MGALAGVLLLSAAAACGGSDEPEPFGGEVSHATAMPDSSASGGPGGSASSGGSAAPGGTSADAAAAARWGLEPFRPAPPAPAVKPVKANPADPPVLKKIPTDQKIVFVTIDDGAEQDPKFVEMMRDMKVPFTMFLNDTYIRQNPDYFRQLQQLGNTVQNHTLDHPNMVTLGADAQKREICGNSDRIEQVYGKRPYLFRPPFGNYNATTVQAAGGCGIGAFLLWRESMQISDMQYVDADKKLKPGDVILAHFRGPSDLKGKTMTEMMANLFRKIQAQGFTIARLEDYV